MKISFEYLLFFTDKFPFCLSSELAKALKKMFKIYLSDHLKKLLFLNQSSF